mgnify:CR=1 FL=1
MKSKKGAETNNAGNIAVLVALIALFIIIYVLLLPPSARRELLGDESGVGVGNNSGSGNVYFSRYLGELSPSTQVNTVYHNIPAVNMFTTNDKDLTTLSGYLQVSSAFIGSKSQNLAFNLDSPEDVKKASLYLLVEEADGNLILKLNGQEIYNNQLRANIQETIELPLQYLQGQNNIQLFVSSPGWMFWKTNNYKIRDIKLRKETKISNRIVERTISIPASEWGSIDKAILKYSVFCDREEDNILSIFVNDQLLYKDVPFCNIDADEIEVDKNNLVYGTNKIRFETMDGDYLIEQISLKTLLQKETRPEEVFSVSQDEYKDIRRGLKNVVAYIDFGNRGNRRLLNLDINGEVVEVDTDQDVYSLKISDYIKQGGNSIKIEPRNTFEIIEFNVELV